MQESRNQIKTRMLKNAARAWGYPETEAENNFDPLVSMLLTACAAEMEKISGEVHASRARVLERLVQLLSPDILTGALPAHAIACALPLEMNTELSADVQLHTSRALTPSPENDGRAKDQIFFSPTSRFRLNKSSIRYMATGDQLYNVTNTMGKEVIARNKEGLELPGSTLWLGIDEPMVSLHESLFYFDFRNEADSRLFYHQLPKASWHFHEHNLQHCPGYGNREISGETLDLENILGKDHDVSGKIRQHINAYYKPSFISLMDPESITSIKEKSSPVPGILTKIFPGDESKKVFELPLRWIRICFPETISNRLLQDLTCMMNCFPVMNRRLHELRYRIQEIVNIIPLQTDDLFLDLEEVSNDEGNVLNVRCFERSNEGSFAMLMRNGGIGRFDERDAAAMVDYVLELLRDEIAAFSSLGNDFMNSEIRQLQQVINKLEQRLFSRDLHREQTPYLVIRQDQKRPWRNLFIRYWSTNGMNGNNIKAGTCLQQYKGGVLNGNQAVLVTTTLGGRNKLGTTDTMLAYKSALLSKDRLVTQEDIKAFCHYQLGHRVTKIVVEKGVMVHPGEQVGFLKTIDVVITVEKNAFTNMVEKGELEFWVDNLKLLLEEKSSLLMPYRVFIQQAA